MWIAVRVVVALFILGSRLLRRLWPPRRAGELPSGAPYFVRLEKHKGQVTGFRLGAPLEAPWFRLHRESDVDRRFKALGLSTELQTGDPTFDAEVYVAGDHPSLHHLLRTDQGLRQKIGLTLSGYFESITSEGGIVWLERTMSHGPLPEDVQWLDDLRNLLLPIERTLSRRLPHPFWWTALIVETVIWSLFAYAVPCALMAFGPTGDGEHLFWGRLVAYGVATALLIFALLFGAITLFLRRSSRGHRLLVESALLLLFALPVVGTTAIADLNRELDRAASVQLSRKIVQVEQRRRWWSKRRSYSYYLHLEGPSSAEPITLSSPLEVSHGMYLRAFPGRHVEFEIGPGWLGMPWYRSIDLR